jgi:acyl dehydratase
LLTQSAPFFLQLFPTLLTFEDFRLAMRMQVDGIIGRTDSLGGLGVDEVKWLAPLRPGDDITLEVHVDEARLSKSRPDAGIVKIRAEMLNASGTRLMSIVSNGLMRRREART